MSVHTACKAALPPITLVPITVLTLPAFHILAPHSLRPKRRKNGAKPSRTSVDDVTLHFVSCPKAFHGSIRMSVNPDEDERQKARYLARLERERGVAGGKSPSRFAGKMGFLWNHWCAQS